jgi:hypothetical protein
MMMMMMMMMMMCRGGGGGGGGGDGRMMVSRAEVLGCVGVYIVLCSMYYWCVSRHSQVISPEEEAVMFIAYVIKQNQKRTSRNNMKKLRNDRSCLGLLRRVLLTGDLRPLSNTGGGKGTSKAGSTASGADEGGPDEKARAERLKEINERKAKLAAAQAAKVGRQ